MQANQFLSADILDIIFEGRNKKYGAYVLRKTYPQRMLKALIGSLLFMSGISLLLIHTQEEQQLATAMVFIPEPELYPPPIPEPTQPKKPTSQRSPSTGKKKKVLSQITITTQHDLADTLSAGIDSETPGDATTNSGQASTLVSGSGGYTNSEVNVADSTTHSWQSFIKEEKDAAFPGGLAAWKKFLERKIDADIPVQQEAPEGVYTVIVAFTVGPDGRLHKVQSLTNHGYGMEAEAVRVIQAGPRWVPASQNGQPVETFRRQPITFVVQPRD